MSIFDSINRNIKNVFVGSHKGEDIKTEWLDKVDTEKHQKIVPNPLDSMPIANGNNKYHPDPNYNPMPPRPEEEIADDWFDESDSIEYGKNYASRHQSTPDHERAAEEVVTMHEKMYRMATAKYNPFAVGGSESLGGGSEEHMEEPPDLAPSEYEP